MKRHKRKGIGNGEPFDEAAVTAKIVAAARKIPNSTGVRVGVGDDAAVWTPRADYEAILTSDWFLEGTHFPRNVHPAEAIGWKCLARTVSDVAAMGGEPRCFLLNLALPTPIAGNWLGQFLRGLVRASKKFECPLAGGDTSRGDRVEINVTVIGETNKDRAIRRSGARPGDKIFVSGRLGEAELGWRLIRRSRAASSSIRALLRKHLYPRPKLTLGKWLADKRAATAMMDLSDGLSSDLTRLCDASGVGARIFENKIPVAGRAFLREFRKRELQEAAVHGGDDYELLFTASPVNAAKIRAALFNGGITEIGEVTSARGIKLANGSGAEIVLTAGGWDPFRR